MVSPSKSGDCFLLYPCLNFDMISLAQAQFDSQHTRSTFINAYCCRVFLQAVAAELQGDFTFLALQA